MQRLDNTQNSKETDVQVPVGFEPTSQNACGRRPTTYTAWPLGSIFLAYTITYINLLKTQRRLLYLKAQDVPRSKHFSSRL